MFHLLKTLQPYDDTVFPKHDHDAQTRAENQLRRQAAKLGFQVIPVATERA